MENIVKIKEDVEIPGTNITLEKGDRIEILKESRFISPGEEARDMDGRTIRPGDIVDHSRFGKGQIQSIDASTYSIAMVSYEPFNMEGEIIARQASEFTKRG